MPPAPVPETALKKRRRDEEWAAARATAAAEARAKRAASRADAFKRAESYVKEYRAQVGLYCSFSSLSRGGDDRRPLREKWMGDKRASDGAARAISAE
jgi:hypothetical protein